MTTSPFVEAMDELALLRAFAEAHRQYQETLKRVCGERLVGDPVPETAELVERAGARDRCFDRWWQAHGKPRVYGRPDAFTQHAGEPYERPDAERARTAGAV